MNQRDRRELHVNAKTIETVQQIGLNMMSWWADDRESCRAPVRPCPMPECDPFPPNRPPRRFDRFSHVESSNPSIESATFVVALLSTKDEIVVDEDDDEDDGDNDGDDGDNDDNDAGIVDDENAPVATVDDKDGRKDDWKSGKDVNKLSECDTASSDLSAGSNNDAWSNIDPCKLWGIAMTQVMQTQVTQKHHLIVCRVHEFKWKRMFAIQPKLTWMEKNYLKYFLFFFLHFGQLRFKVCQFIECD